MSSSSYRKTRFTLVIMLLSLWTSMLSAQDSSLGARVRALNNELLRLHSLVQRATPAEAATLRSQAAPAIEQRTEALSTLIEQNPAEALSLAFPPDLLAQLAVSFPQSAARLESQGTWQGEVDYLIVDDVGMQSGRSIRRLRVGQELLEIFFAGAEPAGLKCNDQLLVRGMRAGSRVAAQDGGSTIVASAAAATCSTIGAQNIVAILVNLPNYSLGATITPDLVKGILLGNAYAPTSQNTPDWSVDGFWKENSDGQTWVDPGMASVVGPFTVSSNFNTNASGASYCDSEGIRAAAIAAADPFVNFQNYSRVILVFPPNGACGWAGLGTLGCRSNSSADGTFNASIDWNRSDQMANRSSGVRLITHELGHNLTMHHASSRDFGIETLGALGAAGTLTEYGDLFSTMGSWNFGFYSAHHAAQQLNWLTPTTNYLTVESSGTYTIQNYEGRPAARKALKVRRGTGNEAWLWIESRKNRGIYDSQIGSQSWSGALIHYQDSTTGTHTHLLDFYRPDLNGWTDPALPSGSSWSDGYSNVSLSVSNPTPTSLDVTVTYGAVPCTLANPTVTLSPSNPSVVAGTSVNYTVSVKNNDSAGCTSSTFNLTSTQPSGWGAGLLPASLTIAPGSTSTATLTETPPSTTTANTYPISVTATNSANSAYAGTGSANCTVTAPPPPLSVTVTAGGPYAPRTTVTMTATVLSGTTPLSGATVKFTMTRQANNKNTTKTVTTGSNGIATWNFKLTPKDPLGTYTVTAVATYGSQSATSAPVTFTVAVP